MTGGARGVQLPSAPGRIIGLLRTPRPALPGAEGTRARPAKMRGLAAPPTRPMPITLYNSLTRRTEPFAPLDPERVTMYLCGPTVYNYVHIGNARGPVVFDVL